MRTIAVINQKGGCGKTTTAVNLAATFASRRFRTLLVDMDPQSHCAAALGVPENQIERDISDALIAPAENPIDTARILWRISRGFDLVPSRTRLAGLEAARGGLSALPDRERRLKDVLHRLAYPNQTLDSEPTPEDSHYDVCLIDCPPSIGLLTFNALLAASEIMIPVETSFFSLRGASKQMATIRSISRRLGIRPKTRILATMHDRSAPLANDLLEELREKFSAAVIPTVIRHDQSLKDAASFGRPVCDVLPDSVGAQDYASLCEWLIEHSDIERCSADDMLEFEGELGRRTAPGNLPRDLPQLRASQSAHPQSAETDSTQSSHPPARPMTRLEDLTRRAKALQKPESELTPKPSRSAQPQRSYFNSTTPRLPPPPSHAPETAEPGKSARAQLAKPVAVELLEDEPEIRVVDSVRRLLGVRRTSRGALFVQPISTGKTLAIAGSFNGWSAEVYPMKKNTSLGVFELQIELAPGQHEYKLVVDGTWAPDRYNPISRPDEFGGVNSIVDLPDLSRVTVRNSSHAQDGHAKRRIAGT